MPTPQTIGRPGASRGTSASSRATLAGLVAVLTVLPGCATVKPFSGESVKIAVEHMLLAVGEAAKISSSRSRASGLELSEATVTLETIAEKSSSGELTLLVVTFDASREKETTQSISVSLKPPKEGMKSASMTEDDITCPHREIVMGLAKGFDAAYLAASGARGGLARSDSGDAPLEASAITVEVNFTVIGSASAAPTVEIFGAELTGSHTPTRENVHQVELVFTEKSADSSSGKKTT